MGKILVWDVPTRIGHWLLVITFILSFITGDSEEQRLFHVAAGYAVGGVIVFRIFWGRAGTRYARFTSFLFTPREVVCLSWRINKGQARPLARAQPSWQLCNIHPDITWVSHSSQ